MGEWKEYQLDELASVTGGKRLPPGAFLTDTPNSHPYIRTRDLAGNKVDANALQFVPDDVFPHIKQYIVTAGDIIVSVVGTIGLCAMIPEELHNASLTENCNRISGFKTTLVNPEYLFFYLTGSVGQDELRQRTVGSTQPKLPMYNLREMPVPLPPIEEQRAIASVLSSLDAKIDLLHRQNKTLEAMAEALFRQWFVEEAEEGWEEVELCRFVDCVNGVSYKSSELNPSKTALVTLKNFARDGGFRLDGFKEFDGDYKPQHEVFAGDLVVAHTDITQDASLIGNPVLVVPRAKYDRLVISMDLVKVVPKENWCSKIFLYHLMRTGAFKEHAVGYSNGSTVLHLSKKAVPEFEFLLPPKEKVARFTEVAEDLHRKKDLNIVTIDNLTALRDTLLPKLMSGEVRVGEQ